MSEEAQIPEELVITLRKPVVIGPITYETLTLREPTVGQTEEWKGLEGAASDTRAVAVVSGLPEPAVQKIGVRDLRAAAAFIARHLSDEAGAPDPDAEDETVIRLRTPITLKGKTVTEVPLREPTAGEAVACSSLTGVTADIKLISDVSGIKDMEIVRLMGIRDFNRAERYIRHFFS